MICDETGWVDFGALQARLGTARTTVATVALARPAVLMVFDVLRLAAVPLIGEPLAVRRSELAPMLEPHDPCLQLVDQTDEFALDLVPTVVGIASRTAPSSACE